MHRRASPHPDCPRGRGVARAALFAAILVGTLAALSCGPTKPNPDGTSQRDPTRVDVRFDREVVVRSSILKFELVGTGRMVPESATVEIVGRRGPYQGREVSYDGEIRRKGDVGDLVVALPVDRTLWSDFEPSDGEVFTGEITVEVSDEIGVAVRGVVRSGQWVFRENMEPRVESLSGGPVFVDQMLELRGSGFLRPDEGTTRAVVTSGEVRPKSGTNRDLAGANIPVEWTGSRKRALLPVDPAVFGVEPAEFEVTLRFENQFAKGDRQNEGAGHRIQGTIQKSRITALEPDQGSRGQKITVRGRGLVPSDAQKQYGMYLRYEGTLDPRSESEPARNFTGEDAITRVPNRVVRHDRAEQSIWYSVEDRKLRGLGATPGTFDGTITPVLFGPHGRQEGRPWRGTFEILPTKQVIYLKYLPAFSEALERYGLSAVEGPIRDRVRKVVERDYSQYHVEVREREPRDFADYATIELGGPDPSGTRAFGFDNSFNGVAKDTGNLYLADYLGGVNAEAAEEFNNPYGGVFLSSFVIFSEELSPNNPHSSRAFDRILGPFMPKLGGTPVRADEWPNGKRADDIERAIRMVGSVVGNTVTHEVGHSMGMTFVPGDFDSPGNVFHNETPGPFIMDGGAERPFVERAEIGGAGPARWNDDNRRYLQRILPKPE